MTGTGPAPKRGLLRLAEISDRIGVPVSTLRYWRHSGGGPPLFTLGRRLVGYTDEIDAWVEQQRRAQRGPRGAA